MNVITAKSAGFCFGVERAVDTVYKEREMADNIATYGPIIHNQEVVKDMEKKGIIVFDENDDLDKMKEKTVILRSHGVSKDVYEMIEKNCKKCVDATCPFVKRIHNIVSNVDKDTKVMIIGNSGHPEVEGIKGWCETPAIVVEEAKDLEHLDIKEDQKLCIVSQTTFNYSKFQDIVEIITKKGYNVNVVNTICNATWERQSEAREIAKKVDTMIVIGDKHSSNTRKLYEICSKECGHTYYIQTLEDLHLELPDTTQTIGITAGASTPKNIIEEVQNYVRINF